MSKKLKTLSKPRLLKLKPFLDDLVSQIEQPGYIDDDPVQFMHAFPEVADQELAGFFAAIMAWGRRDIVNAKVEDLLTRMNYKPSEFIGNFSDLDARHLEGFKHRTFKPEDMYWLIKGLAAILQQHNTFESFWDDCNNQAGSQKRELIAVFHERFFELHPETPQRTRKHLSNPEKNSSAKRLYMFLRWCIRKSTVDTGIWNFLPPSALNVPLDVHVARQARILGLLSRHQNDWKSVVELTGRLRIMDPEDPVKYDFALFGVGVLGQKIPPEFIVNQPSS
ncbi:MAG: TIGR02757 family protein [Bacteroidota bacterium]